MQGTHIFRRDRTTQLIKCTPWNTRLCPHLTIIKKMKIFLEVEGKMGPIPQPASSQYRPPQPDTNPKVRKDTMQKRKRAASTKRFRPSTAPKPSKAATQPPATAPKALEDPENRPPTLEKAPVYKSTPWPGAGRMLGNLFEDRNWLLPPNYLNNDCKKATGPKSTIKEPKTGEQEKCGWGPNCPFSKNLEKEDWDGKHRGQFQKVPPQPEVQRPQARCPQNLNYQKPQSTEKSTQEVQPGIFPNKNSYTQTQTERQWEEEMERLNSKYNLDCFSDSELDSESDEGEQYQYEHGYEALI